MSLAGLLSASIAATSVAAFFGGWWWPLDLIAGFRPYLGGGALVVAGLLAGARRTRSSWVCLAAALVNFAVVVPLFVAPTVPGQPTETTLEIVSFNVLNSNTRFEDVTEFIRLTDPDVVFLQESFLPWEEAITEANLPYRVVINRGEGLIFATMVLVREGAEVEAFGFAEGEPRAVQVVVETGEGPVMILGVHPLSPTDRERAVLRDAQMEFASKWAQSQDGRVVVVGDFNSTPWSYPFRRLVAETGLHNSMRGHGLAGSFPTYRHPLLRIPIDHLLYSDGLAVVQRTLGPHLGSDHLPLTVELALTKP